MCKVNNCHRKASRRGMCRPCLNKLNGNQCQFCVEPVVAKNLCSRHWQRQKNGVPMNYVKTKGRTYVSPNGYIVEYKVGHIQADKDGKVLQHRRIMADLMKRRLFRYENVHHKNGNRSDNSPNNLELWITRQPSGQRIEDLVEWAEWILKEYKIE